MEAGDAQCLDAMALENWITRAQLSHHRLLNVARGRRLPRARLPHLDKWRSFIVRDEDISVARGDCVNLNYFITLYASFEMTSFLIIFFSATFDVPSALDPAQCALRPLSRLLCAWRK